MVYAGPIGWVLWTLSLLHQVLVYSALILSSLSWLSFIPPGAVLLLSTIDVLRHFPTPRKPWRERIRFWGNIIGKLLLVGTLLLLIVYSLMTVLILFFVIAVIRRPLRCHSG